MTKRERGWSVALTALALVVVSPLFAPRLPAFPYRAETPIRTVHSVDPMERADLDLVTDEAKRLVAASPIARPLTRAVVVNKPVVGGNRLANGGSVDQLFKGTR